MKDHPRLNDISSVKSSAQDSVAKTIKGKRIKIPGNNPTEFDPFDDKQKNFFDQRAKPVVHENNILKMKKNSFIIKSEEEDSDDYEEDFDDEEKHINKVADNILSNIKSPTGNSKIKNNQRNLNSTKTNPVKPKINSKIHDKKEENKINPDKNKFLLKTRERKFEANPQIPKTVVKQKHQSKSIGKQSHTSRPSHIQKPSPKTKLKSSPSVHPSTDPIAMQRLTNDNTKLLKEIEELTRELNLRMINLRRKENLSKLTKTSHLATIEEVDQTNNEQMD